MFSFCVALLSRCSSCSLPPRVRGGQAAPMALEMVASAVFCTREDQERHTREARTRSGASRKLNHWIFTSMGIQILDMAACDGGVGRAAVVGQAV